MSNYVDFKKNYTLKLSGYEIVRLREYLKTAVVKAKDIEMFSELKNKLFNLEEEKEQNINSTFVNDNLKNTTEITKNIKKVITEIPVKITEQKIESSINSIESFFKNKISEGENNGEEKEKSSSEEVIEDPEEELEDLSEEYTEEENSEDENSKELIDEEYSEEEPLEEEEFLEEEEEVLEEEEEQKNSDVLAKYRQNINQTSEPFSEEKAYEELVPTEVKKKNINSNINNNFDMPNAFGVPKVGFKDIINKKK